MNPRNDLSEPNDAIERELAAASAWPGRETALWESALRSRTSPAVVRRTLFARIAAIAAIVVVGMVIVGVMLPSLGKGGSSRASTAWKPTSSSSLSKAALREATDASIPLAGIPTADFDSAQGKGYQSATSAGDAFKPVQLRVRTPVPLDARQVIRKAQITLAVPDVRGAFLKVGMIVSEAQGEYIQESALNGEDAKAASQSGSLTLRVAATRLSTVLNELRQLGLVVSESSGGEDVTEQMVDIEARLRNEQRIESELITLLDSRKGSPLNEILQVRQSLSDVRERIERLAAQRERISRLVSLATVLVLIRHQDAGQVAASVPPRTFLDQLAGAWHHGVPSLVGSVAWLVEVIVGGLLVWLAMLATVVAAVALWRRFKARAADEPPPLAA